MRTTRIAIAVKEIERNEAALKWLEEYGVQLNGRDRDSIGISVHPNFAGSCFGAKEAGEVLASFIRLDIAETVQTAIRNCRNTIELETDAIRAEVSRHPSPSGERE